METKPQGVIDWFARNPRVGLLGTIASLIGLPLAIVLFLASEKERDIRFEQSASPTTIIRAGQSSDLRVQFKGRDLNSDVSSLQLTIWNAGRESVRRENILSKTLTMTIVPATTILEARVKKTTRDLLGFQLENLGTSLVISWDILEPGDGALLEVIYTGTVANVKAEGAIEGKIPITEDIPEKGLTQKERFWLVGGMLVISLLAALRQYLSLRPRAGREMAALTATTVVIKLLFFMGFVVIGLKWLYSAYLRPGPPFPF